MTYSSTSDRENVALPLPITQRALQLAEQFARQQPTQAKAEQVRLNTVAVCVMNDYLQMMGISTNLSAGDSWNPVVQLCADVADLQTGAGRLECRPLSSLTAVEDGAEACMIPPEVWHDRIGYVVLQIDLFNQEANLLGFVEQAAVEELPLSSLQPPEELLDHLDRLFNSATVMESNPQPIIQPISQNAESSQTRLGQWLQNIFEAGWQTVEALLSTPELQLAYEVRGEQPATVGSATPLRRAKLIRLNPQTTERLLMLIVELNPLEQQTQIRLQLHPIAQFYLPPNLVLTILDEAGNTFLQAQSTEVDNYIQLELSGEVGEAFDVQIRLGDDEVTESFVI